jgi:hypothetical protein
MEIALYRLEAQQFFPAGAKISAWKKINRNFF